MMDQEFDAIVIGSGAGGAVFATACARAGRSVLVVERGRAVDKGDVLRDEQRTLIDKYPYDDRVVQVNEIPLRLYMGGVLGGGTAVFGGAMMRPSSDDFHPGRHYGDRLPRELWDWPITYVELEPFYEEVERWFHVAGDTDACYEPLHAPCHGLRHPMLPLAPINELLMSASRRVGLRPFRLPLAIDASKCLRCDSCAGFLCANGARRSSAQILQEARSQSSLHILDNVEVVQFHEGKRGKIDAVSVRDRGSGQTRRLRGGCYALAAGAIGSPALLLRSGFDGPQVGCNYMLHYSPIAMGVFARRTGANGTFIKQVGFADFYFGTEDCRHKLGLVQSLPTPGPLMLRKSGLRGLPGWLLRALRQILLPLAGIVEDLPRQENRIYLKPDGSVGVRHSFSDFDRDRGAALGRAMARVLRTAGALKVVVRPFPSYEHVAHQCGTLRMGKDPRFAAVDPDGRVFGKSNLFVVDGSVLPTSLGVGPSLTIAANALRVAGHAMSCL